jgi:hypothetical protein
VAGTVRESDSNYIFKENPTDTPKGLGFCSLCFGISGISLRIKQGDVQSSIGDWLQDPLDTKIHEFCIKWSSVCM